MGYMEEIFKRTEERFTSDSAKLAWLEGFNKRFEYGVKANQLASEIRAKDNIEREYKQTDELDKLRNLRDEADSLKFYGGEVSSDIQFKINKIQKELAEISEEREKKRLEEEEEKRRIEHEERMEVRRQERELLEIQRRYDREQERLKSEDRRKRENAKRVLEKMRARGEIE
jgi:hypothetical protein